MPTISLRDRGGPVRWPYLNDHYPGARCLLLNSGQIGEDLAGVALTRSDDPAPVDGAFVTGLEQAAGMEAQVVGRPAAAFFATALAHSGTPDHVLDSFAGLPALLQHLS